MPDLRAKIIKFSKFEDNMTAKMEDGYISLKEFLSDIGGAVEDMFPDSVRIVAEIASLQVRQNGHCYLELSQTEDGKTVAKARAVIWKSRYFAVAGYFESATGSPLAAGMSVLLRVRLSFSEVYGMTLVIEEIEPAFTLGAAEMEKKRTVEELVSSGLIGKQGMLQPSALPGRLAVISAEDAAGYGDFCRHLEENQYGFKFEVVLFRALMQGAAAPASIVSAIREAGAVPERFDAVLVLRGGGSVLDLSCFDNLELCKAIAECPLPVYTAIGHDRDYHVADMVAYRHLKTPTALADEFISAFAAEDERIDSFGTRLRLAFSSRLSAMEADLSVLESRIHSADPANVLKRGFALVAGADGVVLKGVEGVRGGDALRILFADGELEAEVKNVIKRKNI